MTSLEIKINVQIGSGRKEFEVYTMDLTKKYIEIKHHMRKKKIIVKNIYKSF